MSKIKSLSYSKFFACLFSILALRLIPGLADSSSTSSSTTETKAVGNKSTRNSTLPEILIIVCLGLLAVCIFSVFMYKRRQSKKREDQQARRLKLFERDDQLEAELGLRGL